MDLFSLVFMNIDKIWNLMLIKKLIENSSLYYQPPPKKGVFVVRATKVDSKMSINRSFSQPHQ